MKFTIQNGPTTLEFEGELEEFDRLAGVVDIPPDLLASMRTDFAPNQPSVGAGQKQDQNQESNGTAASASDSIDVRVLAERLGELEAKSDIDRVTVMAHAAREAGFDGIDYNLAERLFVELGERKPTRIRATFQNAKARGLVRAAGRGTWAPTVAGENYARLGHKKPRQRGGGARASTHSGASKDTEEP